MRRKITRTKGARFCTLEVEIEDRNGKGLELSICGEEGRIVKRSQAKKEALAYWESYFDENPVERFNMGERFGKSFRTARSAARFVLSTDGEFHGLDVTGPEEGSSLRIVESAGQITETLAAYFPEVAPYLKYHLNGLKAECVHQEARGETWQTHPSTVCPDCGYKLGSAWQHRALPPEVIAWAEGLPGTLRKEDRKAG